jgi:gas vesicle protein
MAGALVGAVAGGLAGFLFCTERGRRLRDRIEPAVDELRGEFLRFQRTIRKLGDVANEGVRVVHEFQLARAQMRTPESGTSH